MYVYSYRSVMLFMIVDWFALRSSYVDVDHHIWQIRQCPFSDRKSFSNNFIHIYIYFFKSYLPHLWNYFNNHYTLLCMLFYLLLSRRIWRYTATFLYDVPIYIYIYLSPTLTNLFSTMVKLKRIVLSQVCQLWQTCFQPVLCFIITQKFNWNF